MPLRHRAYACLLTVPRPLRGREWRFHERFQEGSFDSAAERTGRKCCLYHSFRGDDFLVVWIAGFTRDDRCFATGSAYCSKCSGEADGRWLWPLGHCGAADAVSAELDPPARSGEL